jgi:hypothetical protein
LYVLTIGGDPITLEALAVGEADRAIEEVAAWWQVHRVAGRILSAAKLMPPFSATTVRFAAGSCQIRDGPSTRETDAVGAFGIIEVTDIDEALQVAQSWPLDGYVEIRPLMSATGRIFGYRAGGPQE